MLGLLDAASGVLSAAGGLGGGSTPDTNMATTGTITQSVATGGMGSIGGSTDRLILYLLIAGVVWAVAMGKLRI